MALTKKLLGLGNFMQLIVSINMLILVQNMLNSEKVKLCSA